MMKASLALLCLTLTSPALAGPREQLAVLQKLYKNDSEGGPRLAHLQPGAASRPGRAYALRGTHPERGAYTGQLEWRSTAGGGLEILRVVTYDTFRFEGFRVQEVWAGKGTVDAEGIRATFLLKRAESFDSVDGLKRAPEDYARPLEVQYHASLTTGAVASDAVAAERIDPAGHAGSEEPSWKNERWYMPTKGESYALLGALANATLFRSITKKYVSHPFIAPYKDRPEFRSKFHFVITDRTDFSFHRAHPDTLRVVNKISDPIALTEASVKRDAFAPTLAEKAAAFDLSFSSDHLNELGLYVSAWREEGKPLRQAANGDGALWCGMYAGSQAMRWLTTRDPQALANFRRIVKGLMLLMDITGDPREFARTAEPYHGEALSPPWKRGAAPFAHLMYIEGGNNDMVKGLFHAFAWAFEILPESDPLRAEVAAHAKRLPKLKVNKEINHVRNIFFSHGLAALAGAEGALASFFRVYGTTIVHVDSLGLEQGYYMGGVADWSGINLKMVSQVTEVLIANQIHRRFAAARRKTELVLRNARRNLVGTWGTYATARKDFFTAAAHAFGANTGPLGLPENTRPATWARRDLWNLSLEDVAWRLREFPTLRARHVITFNFSRQPHWSPSAWPSRPWKVYSENDPIENFFQSAYEYPIFERGGVGSDNFWSNGIEFSNGGPTFSEHGRVDYLYTYWMARLGGLVDTGS